MRTPIITEGAHSYTKQYHLCNVLSGEHSDNPRGEAQITIPSARLRLSIVEAEMWAANLTEAVRVAKSLTAEGK